ncbi:MAG TPA: D-alanyl-D-alanine carboxypeptidase/D-alanyl-D-alanine-endopeptidase, partial [Vicinamibacterales bacterium]
PKRPAVAPTASPALPIAGSPSAMVGTRTAAPAPRVTVLQAELDRIFQAAQFDRSLWGIKVQSLDSDEVLYARDAAKLMMPASNMKIVTLATTVERLGWDFTFETKLVASGPIEDGVLHGDLIVVGSGDPTFNGRGGPATRVFDGWADQLKAAGVTRIAGRIVADGRAFDPEGLGAGWAWDDLGSGYAAPVGALQFNEDVAEVAIRPGGSVGAPAIVEIEPPESGLVIENHVRTTDSGDTTLDIRRLPGSDRIVVTGDLPLSAKETKRAASVDRPALYFARTLRSTLIAREILVEGDAVEVSPAAPPSEGRVLVAHRSPPLSEIARVLMKVSQNLYAETLVKTLGAQSGVGSTEAGQKVEREVLQSWGVPPEAYVLADGSGLSRYNYVCAETIVRILRQLYRDPRHRQSFMETLPIGGTDGTIARRFIASRATGNVKAKTGSIANVRALSGYVTTADGEALAFSIIANNFAVPAETIYAATDLAVERLAVFTRR